jgi:hypothetical protein
VVVTAVVRDVEPTRERQEIAIVERFDAIRSAAGVDFVDGGGLEVESREHHDSRSWKPRTDVGNEVEAEPVGQQIIDESRSEDFPPDQPARRCHGMRGDDLHAQGANLSRECHDERLVVIDQQHACSCHCYPNQPARASMLDLYARRVPSAAAYPSA